MSRQAAFLACLALAACSPDATPPETPDAQGEPIARLGDEWIHRDDVGARTAFRIYRHELDIYSLLRQDVEEWLETRLIEDEAQRRGITPEELLRSEVDAHAEPATDADVERYLDEHPEERASATPESRERIRYYLSETRRIERRIALMERLREEAGFELLLEPPVQPRTDIDTDGAPARGPADAPVTLVHFATFRSRDSARSVGNIERIRAELGDRVRWVHRAFLGRRDELDLWAAQVGALAHRRGDFWAFHDAIYAAKGRFGEKELVEAARSVGLSRDEVEAARSDAPLLAAVKRDIDAAAAAGATREPTIFVNGRYFSGLLSYRELRSLVLEELGDGADSPRTDRKTGST